MNDVREMKEAIAKIETIEREEYGELSVLISDYAGDEAYANDKSLHSLFEKYKDNDKALSIINETLMCVCGWSLEGLVSKMFTVG